MDGNSDPRQLREECRNQRSQDGMLSACSLHKSSVDFSRLTQCTKSVLQYHPEEGVIHDGWGRTPDNECRAERSNWQPHGGKFMFYDRQLNTSLRAGVQRNQQRTIHVLDPATTMPTRDDLQTTNWAVLLLVRFYFLSGVSSLWRWLFLSDSPMTNAWWVE
ncbi:hypothetical protein BJ742DRAFT_271891 [Cladochytrium replicatum]|nr:hypothetical protein BJ742DRAFT_271891 [Cladochytrium replicatum]